MFDSEFDRTENAGLRRKVDLKIEVDSSLKNLYLCYLPMFAKGAHIKKIAPWIFKPRLTDKG